MTSLRTFVLDAWPIVEWLLGKQPAARRFTLFLNEAEQPGTQLLITRINLGEVRYTLAKRLSVAEQARANAMFYRLALTIVSVDDALVDTAVGIKANHACSYADCFAAALAIRVDAPVVTGDSEFLKLRDDGPIELVWLG